MIKETTFQVIVNPQINNSNNNNSIKKKITLALDKLKIYLVRNREIQIAQINKNC